MTIKSLNSDFYYKIETNLVSASGDTVRVYVHSSSTGECLDYTSHRDENLARAFYGSLKGLIVS